MGQQLSCDTANKMPELSLPCENTEEQGPSLQFVSCFFFVQGMDMKIQGLPPRMDAHLGSLRQSLISGELCCLKRATFSNKIASNPPLNQLLISVLTNSDEVSQINQATELYSQAGKMLLNYVLPNSVQSCSLWAK